MILNSRPVPESIAKRITEQGGLAPNGQPLFRVIWGADRLTVIGGEWKKFDDNGNQLNCVVEEKLTTKYINAENRWILEMWCPPENYGDPEEWEQLHTKWIEGKRIQELGPYPANGEYELVKVLETPNKRQFVPLTSTIVEALIAVAVKNKHLPKEIRMAAWRDRSARSERNKELKRALMIDEMAPAFEGKEHVVVPVRLLDGKVLRA